MARSCMWQAKCHAKVAPSRKPTAKTSPTSRDSKDSKSTQSYRLRVHPQPVAKVPKTLCFLQEFHVSCWFLSPLMREWDYANQHWFSAPWCGPLSLNWIAGKQHCSFSVYGPEFFWPNPLHPLQQAFAWKQKVRLCPLQLHPPVWWGWNSDPQSQCPWCRWTWHYSSVQWIHRLSVTRRVPLASIPAPSTHPGATCCPSHRAGCHDFSHWFQTRNRQSQNSAVPAVDKWMQDPNVTQC